MFIVKPAKTDGVPGSAKMAVTACAVCQNENLQNGKETREAARQPGHTQRVFSLAFT